jgi:hypothetical protein
MKSIKPADKDISAANHSALQRDLAPSHREELRGVKQKNMLIRV